MRSPLALVLLLAACSKSPPEGGKDVTVETACDQPSDSQIRVSGWFRYPRRMMSFCSTHGGKQSCDMTLYATAEVPQAHDVMRPKEEVKELPQLRVSVPVGDRPGEMGELPKEYSDKDVVLHLANDQRAGEGAKVTLWGEINVVESTLDGKTTKTCWLDVAWATP